MLASFEQAFGTVEWPFIAIHEETSLKLPQQSVIERQLFIKCLSFPSFGRQVLNTFYIMYIVKLVKHFSLFQVYTLYSCKRCNCYVYTPSTLRGRYIGVCVRYHPHFMDKYEEVDISVFINVSWF
jgi:ribosomal protein L31